MADLHELYENAVFQDTDSGNAVEIDDFGRMVFTTKETQSRLRRFLLQFLNSLYGRFGSDEPRGKS